MVPFAVRSLHRLVREAEMMRELPNQVPAG